MNKPQTRTFRARVRAARPLPSRAFQRGLDHTLAHLPPRKTTKPLRSSPAFWPLAAALVLALALAGPPVVRAAGIWLERLFAGTVAQIEQQQAQPEEVRIADGVASQETYHRAHALHETAQVGDVTVELTGVMLHRGDDDNRPSLGELWPTLSYPNAPADFDPALIDFTLTANGQDFPQIIDDMLADYRSTRRKAGDGEGDWAGVYFVDGVMHSHIAFPFDNWQTDEKVDFVLSAAFPGGQFTMPFTYDPALAHAEARQAAAERLPESDAFEQRRKAEIQTIAEQAAPIAIAATDGDATMTIREMALIDGELHFAISVEGDNLPRIKMIEMNYIPDHVYVDGQATKGGSNDAEVVGGVATMRYKTSLQQQSASLPETSLIVMQAARFAGKDFQLAFRYHWATQTVIAPTDEAERQAWLDLATPVMPSALLENDVLFFPNIAQTHDGLTVTLSQILFWPEGQDQAEQQLQYLFRMVFDVSQPVDTSTAFEATVLFTDGLTTGGTTCESNSAKTQIFKDVRHPQSYAELPEQIPLAITLKIPGYKTPFVFELTLDKKDAHVY